MHRLFICIVAVFLLPASASARVFPIRSYEELFKEADVVAIVKVDKIEDTKARLEGESDPNWYQGKVAHATVGLMLKGDARKTLSFQFFDYNRAAMRKAHVYVTEGPWFASLGKAEKVHYLVFLKKTTGGGLMPATGHAAEEASILEIAPQGPVEIKSEPTK